MATQHDIFQALETPTRRQQAELEFAAELERREDLRHFFPHDQTLYPRPTGSDLVPGLLPNRRALLLCGPPKSGKTALATALAWSVATGTPFAGRPVEQRHVLWLNFEENPNERRALLAQLPPTEDQPCLTHGESLPGLDTEDGLRALGAFLQTAAEEDYPVSLVVVDSLHGALDELDPGRNKSARKAVRRIAELVDRHRAALLLIAHTDAHGRRPGDSVQLQAATGATMLLRYEAHPTRPDERLVHLRALGRAIEIPRLTTLASDAPLRYRFPNPEELTLPTPERPDIYGEAILNALLAAEEPSTVLRLVDDTGLSEGILRRALERLIACGQAHIAGRTGRIFHYRFGPKG